MEIRNFKETDYRLLEEDLDRAKNYIGALRELPIRLLPK